MHDKHTLRNECLATLEHGLVGGAGSEVEVLHLGEHSLGLRGLAIYVSINFLAMVETKPRYPKRQTPRYMECCKPTGKGIKTYHEQ